MAEENNNPEEPVEKIREYEELIDRLKKEQQELRNELNKDYEKARKYVRSHPEEGVLYAFVGGIALGYILSKLGRD